MLVHYCTEALKRAEYKLEDGSWFAEIVGFAGFWANADTVEATRGELYDVPQEWLLLKLRDGDNLPVVSEIDFNSLSAA